MNRNQKIYISVIVLAILALIVFDYVKPQKINWFESYAKQHKIPFGTYVFHDQMKRTLNNKNIVDVNIAPFEFLKSDSLKKGTYFFMNNNVSFGEVELEKILDWTADGNTLFIASNNFEERLLDTLNLETSTLSNFNTDNSDYYLQLKSKALQNDSIYKFDKSYYLFCFSKVDTLNTKVISVVDVKRDNIIEGNAKVNMVKQPFGKGEIILSTFPQVFTNYFILQNPNQDYAAGILSYLDDSQPIYYDNHYKSGKSFYTSPLYIFLNNQSLKWAYYVMIIGTIFYIIFEGRRKQRAIPVVEPLRNQTVDFTRTIANMYYEKSKHTDIAKHKIQHFLDFIRTHLHLNTNAINESFLKNLAARSNNSIDATKTLFKTIESIKYRTELTEKELETLNASIEKFKSNNSWKKTKT